MYFILFFLSSIAVNNDIYDNVKNMTYEVK